MAVRCAVVVALLLVSRAARADPPALVEGRSAYEAGDFDRALTALQASLEAPESSVDDLRDAHRHLALLRFALGDPGAARRHAEAALTLDAQTPPPPGAPPAARALFAEAARARNPLRLTAVTESVAGEPVLRVSVDPIPEALPLRLRVRCRNDLGLTTFEGDFAPRGITLPLPRRTAEGAYTCALSLGTAAGLGVRTAHVSRAAPPPRVALPSGVRWPLVVGLSVGGAALVGAIVGVIVGASAPPGSARFEGPRWPAP